MFCTCMSKGAASSHITPGTRSGPAMETPPQHRKRRLPCAATSLLRIVAGVSLIRCSQSRLPAFLPATPFGSVVGSGAVPTSSSFRHQHNCLPWRAEAVIAGSAKERWKDMQAVAAHDGSDGGGDDRATVLSFQPDQLGEVLEGRGRAKMVWKSLARGMDPFEEDEQSPGHDRDVTARTRQVLKERVRKGAWQVMSRHRSSCGTEKALVSLEDGTLVETVVIPSDNRTTVCVSSQAGCAQACAFCSTGMMGFKRHLSTDEILMQVHLALRITREACLPPLRNIVFMGMGEPLNNAASVTEALRILTHPHAFAFSPGFITVSTVAPSPAHVAKLEGMPARLAWSVHAGDDILRRALVPTTKHSMAELRDAFIEVMDRRGDDEIFIEVTLIEGVNDSLDDAQALVDLLRPLGKRAKVNVIPYNDTGVPGFRPSPLPRLRAFQSLVRERGGWPTFIRTPRGQDDKAACGQLATTVERRRRGGTMMMAVKPPDGSVRGNND